MKIWKESYPDNADDWLQCSGFSDSQCKSENQCSQKCKWIYCSYHSKSHQEKNSFSYCVPSIMKLDTKMCDYIEEIGELKK